MNTHDAVARLTGMGYEIERDGRTVMFYSPPTLAVFTKAVIARQLPHTVCEAEVVDFLSSPTTQRQLEDLMNVMFMLAEPLSVVCCTCAQHAGDADLAAVFGKSELVLDNPNPVKCLHAYLRLAIVQHEQAEE